MLTRPRWPPTGPPVLLCSYNQQQVMNEDALNNFNNGIKGISASVRLTGSVVAMRVAGHCCSSCGWVCRAHCMSAVGPPLLLAAGPVSLASDAGRHRCCRPPNILHAPMLPCNLADCPALSGNQLCALQVGFVGVRGVPAPAAASKARAACRGPATRFSAASTSLRLLLSSSPPLPRATAICRPASVSVSHTGKTVPSPSAPRRTPRAPFIFLTTRPARVSLAQSTAFS